MRGFPSCAPRTSFEVGAIDDYLKKIEPAKRKELQRIRKLAKEAVPKAEETISYGMPTLKVEGKPFLGFDVHKNHIGIYPYSGGILSQLKEALSEYGGTKSAVHVPFDDPISRALLERIVRLRVREIRAQKKTKA